jgi:hypothetical protein
MLPCAIDLSIDPFMSCALRMPVLRFRFLAFVPLQFSGAHERAYRKLLVLLVLAGPMHSTDHREWQRIPTGNHFFLCDVPFIMTAFAAWPWGITSASSHYGGGFTWTHTLSMINSHEERAFFSMTARR